MIAVILILSFIILVSLDKYNTLYKGINEINSTHEQMKARVKLMNYKVYSIVSTIGILIIILYALLTWN
jgi:hypothetical protein